MKSANLVKLSTPFSFAAICSGDKEELDNDISEYLEVKRSEFDKKVQICEWIKSMEEGSTIEELLNSIITIKKVRDKGRYNKIKFGLEPLYLSQPQNEKFILYLLTWRKD
jgi:hypothetical protein